MFSLSRSWEDCTSNNLHASLRLGVANIGLEDNWIVLPKDSKILEIWSGNWVFVKHLEDEWYKNVFGIDKNPRHTEKFPKINAAKWDISSMQYEDGSFDAVFSHFVFDTNLYNQAVASMLSEIHRVLTPNGIYIASEYIESNLIKNITENFRIRANTLLIWIWADTFIPSLSE